MDFEYKSRLDFLVDDDFEYSRYVCFSDYLPDNHPEFIMIVDCDDVDSLEQLSDNIMPEVRTIMIKQNENIPSELIYKIYLKKIGKQQVNEYADVVINHIASVIKARELIDDDEDEDDEDSYVK